MSILKFVRSVRKVTKALDDYMSGRGLDDYDPLDESEEDKLTAQRNAGWARLLKAVIAHTVVEQWPGRAQGAALTLAEVNAAKGALLSLGVDVDALLDVTP